MKKNISILIILFVVIASSRIAAQSAPGLISPADNSVLQKASNLQLVWEALAGNPIYTVQYSLDSNFLPGSLAGSVSVSGNNLVIGQLLNNTVYFWRVRINQQNAPWSDIWQFRTTPLPVVPAIYSPENDTRNNDVQLLFNWSGNEINKSFLLQISLNSSFLGTTKNYVAADTSFLVPNLVNSSDYFWRVKALNIDNVESGWSSVFHFKTKLYTPAGLTPVTNIINTDTSMTFRWNSIDTPATFHFQLSTDSLFEVNTLTSDSLLSVDSLYMPSLNYNTEYFWRVLSFNEDGDSSKWSDLHKFKTKLKSPAIYSPGDSIINSDTSVTISWNSVNGAEEYLVQLSADTLFSNTIINESLEDTIFSLHSLNFFQQYFFRVSGVNSNGDRSNWTGINFRTKLDLPELIFPGDSSINILPDAELTWTNITGADEYNLLIGFDSLLSRLFIDTTLTDTTFSAESFAFDTTYFWQVSGFNSLGDSSGKSDIFQFKTRPPILFSADSLDININLTLQRSDSVAVISVSNVGNRPYNIDSIKISPDSVFIVDQVSSIIQPDGEEKFFIRFSMEKADTGLTEGIVYFIRNNFPARDTLSVKFDFYLRKSFPTFSDSSLAYDSTDATDKIIKEIIFSNRGGNLTLQIDSLSIEGPDTAAFSFLSKIKTPVRIGANDSVSYFIQFDPQRLGPHEASLYIETNSYPDSLFLFPLSGDGRGGELSTTTLARLTELSDTLFEAFAQNDKPIVFKNNGNAPVNVSIKFSQNKFKVGNDFLKSFSVENGDSVSLDIKYMIPDFKESNKDTMRIIHNGFGEDTLLVFLEGSFDSLASSKKLQSDLRLNSNEFTTTDRVLNENTPLNFTLDPELLNSYSHLEFRINYYAGGNGERISAINDGSYTFAIPKDIVDERGMLISGQLLAKDKNNKIIDSVTVFPFFNAQVILKEYKTIDINIPKSIPSDKAENANTKWIMFGFPFEEVVADTVFKEFGGIDNMKDAEWIVYKYDLAAADSFSLFSGYSFEPNKAYFAAQALSDTFKITYSYKENLRTRKLTDTLISLPGTNWKTVSSPYLFDVEIDPAVMLRYWDTNNKVYKMTNIMKPGEGYFVEPSVTQLKLKTYGKYNPLYYPKILANIGWHLKVKASDNHQVKENLFSVENGDKLFKTSSDLPMEYASSPDFQKGLELYTIGDFCYNSEATVHKGSAGSIFSIILKNDIRDSYINFDTEIIGQLPAGFSFFLYNDEIKETISVPATNFFVKKGKEYNLKLIVGNDNYIKKTLTDLTNQVPDSYALSQNYPNPFNPVTAINYQVPENSFVSLKVFDILGSEIITLVNEQQSPGYYKVNLNAGNMASGVYLYKLTAGKFTQVKKMVVLK